MTKLELIAALTRLEDDQVIYIDVDGKGDLLNIQGVGIYNDDGPDAAAFATIRGPEY